MKALGQGQSYKESLLEQLANIEGIATKIDREAVVLSQGRLKRLEDNVGREARLTREVVKDALEQEKPLSEKEMKRLAEYLANTTYLQLSSDNDLNRHRSTCTLPIFCSGAHADLSSGMKTLRVSDTSDSLSCVALIDSPQSTCFASPMN